MGSKQHHLSIGLDTHAEMDFVSTLFVKSRQLSPCTRTKHNHQVPKVEGAGKASVQTYGVYHLRVTIADRWNRPITFTRPFVAIERNASDNPILIGRPILRDLAIVIDNELGTWEFKKTNAKSKS